MSVLLCLPVSAVAEFALAAICVPLDAFAGSFATQGGPVAFFFAGALFVASLAGALLLLESTSWSLMTSRR